MRAGLSKVLVSSSRLGEAILLFYAEALRDWDNSDAASFHKFESDGRKSMNDIGGATNENTHQCDLEYDWTRKESVPNF
jgi:hypothetical protein